MFRASPWTRGVLTLATIVLGAACGNSNDESRPATRIVFDPDPLVVRQLDTLTVHATVVDNQGDPVDNQSVAFESSNEGVVSISATGRLTSTGGLGPATITATQGDVFTSIDVSITQVAGEISTHPFVVSLAAGESRQLVPTLVDVVGNVMTGTVTYAGNNNAAFTVSPTGLVTAVANGSGKVTLTKDGASHQVDVYVGPTPTGTLLEQIPITGAPYSIAVSSDGKIVLTLAGAAKVARGALPAYELPGETAVGGDPLGVTINPAGTKAYVGVPTGVAVVDLATGTATTPILGVGQIFSVIVSADGSRLYATSSGDRVYAINTATNAVTDSSATIGVGQQVILHPTQPLIYVVTPGATFELNATTLATVRTFATGGEGRGVAIAPDGSTLYVAGESAPLKTVNLGNGTITTTALGTGFGVVVRDDELILTGNNSVMFANRTTLTIIKNLEAGAVNRRPALTASGLLIVPDELGGIMYLR